MPDQINTTTEKIKYTTEGLEKVLKANKDLQKSLNELEKSSPTIGINDSQAKEVKNLREELEALKKKLHEGRKEAKDSWDDWLPGTYLGTSPLAMLQRFGMAFDTLKDSILGVVKFMDKFVSIFVESDKAALKFAASGGKVLKGWGWSGAGVSQFTDMASALKTLPKDIGMSTVITGNEVQDVLNSLQKSGLSVDAILRNQKELVTSAVDNSFLLTGSLDGLAQTTETLGDLMAKFHLNAVGADRALKGIAIDAHASGMGMERFLGSVRNISAEMSTYGDHVDEVSGLLRGLGQSVNEQQAMTDAQALLAGSKNISEGAKYLGAKHMRPGEVGGLFKSEATELSNSLADVNAKIESNVKDMQFTAGRAPADLKALQEQRRNLEREKNVLEMRQKQATQMGDLAETGGLDPNLLNTLTDALGPKGLILRLTSLTRGLGGTSDFRNIFGRPGDLTKTMHALQASGKSASEAFNLIRILKNLQEGAQVGPNGEKRNVGTIMDAMTTMSADQRKELEDAMAGPEEIQKRIERLSSEQKTVLDQILTWATNFKAELGEMYLRPMIAKLDQIGGPLKAMGDVIDNITGKSGLALGTEQARNPGRSGFVPTMPELLAGPSGWGSYIGRQLLPGFSNLAAAGVNAATGKPATEDMSGRGQALIKEGVKQAILAALHAFLPTIPIPGRPGAAGGPGG